MDKVLTISGQSRIKFDGAAQAFLLLLLFGQLFFNNGIYLFIGALIFWSIFINLQQPYKPSVFTIIFLYHFMQISAGIWLSNYLGKPIDFRSPHAADAIVFSFIGLIFLFLPIIYYQNKIPVFTFEILKKYADRLSLKKTLNAYIIAFFVANALGGVALSFGGFAQIIISLIKVKWFFFLLFGFQVILKKRMWTQFLVIIGVEFLMGFLSFFSDFKTVFFYIAFLFICLLVKVNLKQLVFAIAMIGIAFFLGIKWTSIKGEYRKFLNQGSKTQTVNVENNEAFKKLMDLTKEKSDFDKAAVNMLDRIQYTYHFSKVMDRVPSVIPYQDGHNWGSILSYTLTPRLLNSSKPKIDNSIKTTKYTGISYLSAQSGVSFSLGYFADSYVDFGYYGMMIPLFLIGLFYGATYFYFVRKSSPNIIFNFSVVGALFMEFQGFEMDGMYFLGRIFASVLTFFMLKIFVFPWIYDNLVIKPNAIRE